MKIAVLGTEETAEEVARELKLRGLDAYAVGAVDVKILDHMVDRARDIVGVARTLVFTSKNAARIVAEKVGVPKGVEVVAIGPKTAEVLARWRPRVPTRHCSSGVVEVLERCPDPIALFSSTKVNPDLENYVVRRRGYVVKLYDLLPRDVSVDADLLVPLSSTSIEKIEARGKVLAISRRIAERASSLGFEVLAVVEVERMEELVPKILDALSRISSRTS